MKKVIFILSLLFLFSTVGVYAQTEKSVEKEKVALSGNVNFSTKAVATILGSVLSDSPQMSAGIQGFYKGFGLNLFLSADLLGKPSPANFISLSPGYLKTWGGGWSLYSALHFEFYSAAKENDLMVPYIAIGNRSWINTNLLLGYAYMLRSGDGIYAGLLSFDKKFCESYKFKVSSANTLFEKKFTTSIMLELSKEITPKVTLGAVYSFLKFNTPHKDHCGVIKLSYNFNK